MDEIIEKLRDKDEKAAYEFAKKIGIESAESDKYVEKIPVFSEMLTDKNSYVRTRAFMLICNIGQDVSRTDGIILISLFIAFIAIMPALAGLLNVQQAFSQFFGGTSLLILVGVVIDTLQQVESHLLMRHYDGLLNSGHTRSSRVSAY